MQILSLCFVLVKQGYRIQGRRQWWHFISSSTCSSGCRQSLRNWITALFLAIAPNCHLHNNVVFTSSELLYTHSNDEMHSGLPLVSPL